MTAIKFMTWNVENLFKPADDASASKISKYQNKLDLLAQTILRLNPDVIAFQEVGGDDPLKDLQRELAGGYPVMAISGTPDRRGIRVAFLSKIAIDEEEEVVDFPPGPALDINRVSSSGEIVPADRMGRGALRIRVAKNGDTFDKITAHLKSKLLTYRRPGSSSFTPRDEEERAQAAGIALMRRSAEVVTLRIYINNLIEGNNTTPLLLMGDFNDVPDAQTSLILCGPDGSEINTRGFNRRDHGDDTRMFNLAPLIDSDRRFSRIHRGRGELLDQILASEEFFPRDQNNNRSLPVADSHIDFKDELRSVGENPGNRVDEIAPDHAPVVAEFNLPD